MNDAVAVFDDVMLVITQLPTPVQAPDHPENAKPVPGLALSVTVAPSVTDAVQVPEVHVVLVHVPELPQVKPPVA